VLRYKEIQDSSELPAFFASLCFRKEMTGVEIQSQLEDDRESSDDGPKTGTFAIITMPSLSSHHQSRGTASLRGAKSPRLSLCIIERQSFRPSQPKLSCLEATDIPHHEAHKTFKTNTRTRGCPQNHGFFIHLISYNNLSILSQKFRRCPTRSSCRRQSHLLGKLFLFVQ
jgi:hypothetical protein